MTVAKIAASGVSLFDNQQKTKRYEDSIDRLWQDGAHDRADSP